MTFNSDPLSTYSVADLLEQAAARTGFTPSQMEDLLDCELNIDHLLDYITAVVSNRMN
jgi:hypothetical protein